MIVIYHTMILRTYEMYHFETGNRGLKLFHGRIIKIPHIPKDRSQKVGYTKLLLKI